MSKTIIIVGDSIGDAVSLALAAQCPEIPVIMVEPEPETPAVASLMKPRTHPSRPTKRERALK